MKATMILFAREVREKARLFAVCAGLALVPFAAALLPGTRSQSDDVIAIAGGFLAAVLGGGIALALGASTIVSDLAEKRMSFYFTKPVSAPAIWIGKAAAGVFISLSCFAIIAIPAALAAPKAWTAQLTLSGLVVLGIVVLFFLIHAMSTVIRSRSPLLALDFVFALLALTAIYLITRPLVIGMAMDLALRVLVAIGIAFVIALAIAPIWQLANGRSDIRRSHAALMRFLWPSVAVVLLIAGGVVAWLTHVSPDDIVAGPVEEPPRGSMVLITGRSPRTSDYYATFVIDRATGDAKRIATPPWWGTKFSDDGRVVVWPQPVGLFSMEALELHTMKGATGIVLAPSSTFAVSKDGARVAVASAKLVTVYELATGKMLASAGGLDPLARQQMFFVTPDVVRVIEKQRHLDKPSPLRVFELDVRARRMTMTAERIVRAQRSPVSISGDGASMFLEGENVILDGRTAQTIAQIDVANISSSEMLYDGRVAVITANAGVPHLRIFGRDGKQTHDVAFTNVPSVRIAAETEEGKVILNGHGRKMLVVDLASAVIERTIDGVRGPVRAWGEPRIVRYPAGHEFTAIDAKGKLVVWKNEGRTVVRPLLSSR